MRIALFESSATMRAITKTSSIGKDTIWDEFECFDKKATSALESTKYDAIITSKEFCSGSLSEMIVSARKHTTNQETPIFLFTSDMSKACMDQAFDLGVTDVFFKQELPALSDTLQKIASYPLCVKGAKVLLVEDNKAISAYYSSILTDLNCKIFQASTCDEAERILDSEFVELVITDLNLEDGGQGQRIIHKMRHNETIIMNKIPIMVLSSIDTLQVQTGLFFLGIDDYIVKPILPIQFSLRAINLIKKFRIYQQAESQADELKLIAHFDGLTKVYNRKGFENIATFCVANCQRQVNSVLGIMYIDLDNFKPVNDTYGHDAGDKVLVTISKKLKLLLREQDVVARWGGDEFVVLLNQCDIHFIQAVCDRILNCVNSIAQDIHGVTCSIGLTYGEPDTYNDILGYISQADKKMYEHKKQKKLSVTNNQA